MSYLIPSDYKKQIQAGNLAEIIRSDATIQADAEQTAIDEASSYLVQKYDLTSELQDTPAWDSTLVYKATNRVYLNAAAYAPASTYNTGAYVSFTVGAGTGAVTSIYKAKQDGITGAWDATRWTLVAPVFQIYTAKFPFVLFQLTGYYRPGDQVFWKDLVYTCLIETRRRSDETILQYEDLSNIPYNNVFPDDVNNGPTYWGSGVAYTVPAATDILNATYWQAGDNRCQQLKTYLVDIALYHMHAAVSPRNVPEMREKRYDDAIKWLKAAGRGDVTASLPLLQPRRGSRNRYGGQIKNNNSW